VLPYQRLKKKNTSFFRLPLAVEDKKKGEGWLRKEVKKRGKYNYFSIS
jgi:hypothetical protein